MGALAEHLHILEATRIETLAALDRLTDAHLERPAPWRGATLDVRFLLLQLADTDEERRTQLSITRDRLGWAPSEAQRILADAMVTRGRLLGGLVGVTDAEWDMIPAPDEWSLRQVIAHVISTERRYAIHTRYAADRAGRIAGGEEGGPTRPPDSMLPSLSGEGLAAGSLNQVREELRATRAETLTALAGIDDATLSAPTDWLGIEFELRFRLHRFAAHERQHLVQVVKTLRGIGALPGEVRLILAEAELARSRLTALTVGLPDEVAAHRPAEGGRSVIEWLADAVAGERTLVAAIQASC